MPSSIVARIAGANAVYRWMASTGACVARHGPLALVERHAGWARLRCSEAHADVEARCLRRQAWLLEAIAHAGGSRASLRESQCLCAGEPVCEYVVSWTARPRPMLAFLAVVVVAAGVGAAGRHQLLPPAAWGLVPLVAIAVHVLERRRCARSATTSSVDSGAAIRWLLARAAAAHAPTPAGAETSAPPSTAPDPDAGARRRGTPVLTQEGEFWRIEYLGQAVLLRHSRGLALLAHLVRSPGRAIHVRDLDAITPAGGSAVPRPNATDTDLVMVPGDADEVLDRQALAAYRGRMSELRVEIDEAEAAGDAARVERLRSELDMLASEVRGAVGIGGRPRRVPPEVERLRTAITRRIRSAIVKIAEHHPKLGAHFEAHVSTGYACAYEPGDPSGNVDHHGD